MNEIVFSVSMFWLSMFPEYQPMSQADFFKPSIVGVQQDATEKAMFVKPVLRIVNVGM